MKYYSLPHPVKALQMCSVAEFLQHPQRVSLISVPTSPAVDTTEGEGNKLLKVTQQMGRPCWTGYRNLLAHTLYGSHVTWLTRYTAHTLHGSHIIRHCLQISNAGYQRENGREHRSSSCYRSESPVTKMRPCQHLKIIEVATRCHKCKTFQSFLNWYMILILQQLKTVCLEKSI